MKTKTVKYNMMKEDDRWVAHINGARRNLKQSELESYKLLCDILAKEWLRYAIEVPEDTPLTCSGCEYLNKCDGDPQKPDYCPNEMRRWTITNV